MADPFNFSELQAYPPELPQQLHEIATKLHTYGFMLKKDSAEIWTLTYPFGHWSGLGYASFFKGDLSTGLLRVLRSEEEHYDVLHRYEQFDSKWGKVVYGNSPNDTTIAEAGCGPTSLAIVLQYLMNNGSRPHNASYADADFVTPLDTAWYAKDHGRVSATKTLPSRGTAGNAMIRDIQARWPEFEGMPVPLEEAAALLREGKLIIFLCHSCSGYNKFPSRHKAEVTYHGHFMVLAGVEGTSGPDQIFYVVDPGRKLSRAMRFIKRSELQLHGAGFWWVYRRGEETGRVCTGE